MIYLTKGNVNQVVLYIYGEELASSSLPLFLDINLTNKLSNEVNTVSVEVISVVSTTKKTYLTSIDATNLTEGSYNYVIINNGVESKGMLKVSGDISEIDEYASIDLTFPIKY